MLAFAMVLATFAIPGGVKVQAAPAQPFGLVLSCPADNTIGVVWGRGDIDSYNVYIDNAKVASNVGCAYYEYKGYSAGSHTVSVTTVSGGVESARTTASVSVNGATGGNVGIDEGAEYYIYSKHSGLVLDVEGGNQNNGANIIQWGKNSGTNQKWKISSVGNGYYKISSVMNGKVIDVSDVSTADGANVHLWDYVGGANQHWKFDFVDGEYATIVSQHSGKGLDVDAWSTAGGGNIHQWTLGNKQANQLWKLEKVNSTSVNPGNTGSNSNGDLPQIPNLAARSDRMYLKLNNKTNGKYSNNQVYWCILGYNSNNELCYVDKNGNLIRATSGMNTISKNGRMCADICYTLAEKDYVYLPDIISGRMYLSYGEQVYITFNVAADGRVGYAGPDLNNATDPNQDVLFEFIEFTVKNKEYWGNTTRVDFYSFPVVTRLIGTNGYTNGQYYANFDRTVGDMGTRAEIFNSFKNEVPDEFDTLVTDMRIMAPCKLTFNEGARYANYYDAYINEFWNKYSRQDLVFTCQAGTFRGRVEGDRMRFTKDGDGGTYYVYKPTTQDVLEGKGNFNRGNSTELVIEAQLCAAFNRGVATQPENYNNANAFYKNSVSNFYSGFWHNHSYDRYAYGFCYDDVNDHSTLLHFTNPTGLIIDLRW